MHTRYKNNIKQCTQDIKKQYKTMYTRYENNRKQCT